MRVCRGTLSLRTSRRFKAAYGGRRAADELFWAAARPNGSLENRLGVSVSRKVGNAAVRNLVKRRVKAAYRGLAPRLAKGVDIAVSAKPGAARVCYADLRKSIERLFGRLGVLKKGDRP